MKLSNCCQAAPVGEADSQNVGRCSKCKDGAVLKEDRRRTMTVAQLVTITAALGLVPVDFLDKKTNWE